jgi:short-subunit dehydrogenase
MSTQSMVRAVITGASSAIGTVYADRLWLNRNENIIDSASREAPGSLV